MIRVHVSDHDFLTGSLSVAIVLQHETDLALRQILRLGPNGSAMWEEFDPTDLCATVEPTFRLPGETGRALLDALAHHYEGSEDTRRLRADYEVERRRVDDQARLIADVLRSLTNTGGTR